MKTLFSKGWRHRVWRHRVNFVTHLMSPILKSTRCTTLIMKQWPANSLGLCSKALIDEIDVSGAEISLTPTEYQHLRFRGVNITINGTFTMELFWRITGDGKFLNEIENKMARKLKSWEVEKLYKVELKMNKKITIFTDSLRTFIDERNTMIPANLFLKRSYSKMKKEKIPGTGQMTNIWKLYESGRTSSGSIELFFHSVVSSVSD